MILKIFPKLLQILLTFLFLSACSILPPAEDCGGGTSPDRDALEEYFADLQLLGRTTDQSENEGPEVGRIFQPTDELAIQAGSNREQTVRLCIFESKPAGEIVFDQTYKLSTGEDVIQLGSFEEGPYVIRVFTNGVLVHNFQFLIR
ncbi:MAG: hypothetical protein PVG32_10415 [Anaerolineales bacterium]|jgi:hypothetical protein